jgi:hypothetical protein
MMPIAQLISRGGAQPDRTSSTAAATSASSTRLLTGLVAVCTALALSACGGRRSAVGLRAAA